MNVKQAAVKLALTGLALYLPYAGGPLKKLGPARTAAAWWLMAKAGRK